MDYLVVAPYTPFFQWQIALLVQSFKLHGMEESLAVLLISEHDTAVVSSYCKSFEAHPRLRLVCIPETSEPDIVRLRGLAYAVQSGFVGRQFTLLPPHCVLRHPIADSKSEIAFSCRPDFTLQHLDGFGLSSKAIIERLGGKRQWLPVGEVFTFNAPLFEIFTTAISRGEMIAFDSYRENFKQGDECSPKNVLRAAMSMTIMEHFNRVKVDTSRQLECQMNDHVEGPNIVNYYYGSPPHFSRSYYPMTGKHTFKFSDDPFQGILRSEDTHASRYMKHVVNTLT